MRNENQHIPSGYKPSPLGPIPEDREVKRLGEVCDIDKESLSNKTDPNYEFDYISLSDVDSDCFETTTSKQTFRTAPSRARRLVKQGDVIISTVRPNLQAFTLIKDKVKDLIVSTGFAVLTPKQIISEYLYQYVFSFPVSKQFYQLVVGSNYPAVNSSDVSHLKIAFPPLSEQKSIVDVLEVWDTAIAKQTALIEQLTLRKRGLMQQLLTGKKRLKGFEGNSFKMLSFDKIANTVNVKAFQVNKSDYQEKGKTPIVDQGQLFIAAYSNSNKVFAEVPFILFGDHTRVIKWIDFQCVIGADGVQAIKPKGEVGIKYLYYLLSNTELPNLGYSRHMSILKEKMFYVSTDIDEQKAIADCLSNADKEIEIQKQKLAAMQEQKKGLMQVLLTGKKRINI